MKHQPSTLARHLSVMPRDTSDMPPHSVKLAHLSCVNHIHRNGNPRVYFTRTAIFSALTTSLVGFGVSVGMAPAAFAATDLNTSTANNPSSSQVIKNIEDDAYEDSQLDIALDALRLKKAVEQGIIDQSVLDDYSEQNLGIKKPNAKKSETDAKKNPSTQTNNTDNSQLSNNDIDSVNDFANNIANNIGDGLDNLGNNQAFDSNENLEQQVNSVQQQGYQMMTPAEIDRELAAMDRQNAQDIDSLNSSTGVNNIDGNPYNLLSHRKAKISRVAYLPGDFLYI